MKPGLQKFYPLFTSILLCLLSYAATGVASSATTPAALNFGIVPQQSATKMARLWTPILQYLSAKSGVALRFRTAPTIPEFEKRLARGEYDLAYMNPYHYTNFHESSGYQAFAKQSQKHITGIIVVRKDNPINSVTQLQSSTLAFPSPAAFAASILPRAYLKQQGVPFSAKYVASHDSVYRAVAAGLYPAGGGIVRTLNNSDPLIKDQLKILWTSQPYTPHAFAALNSVDPARVQALQKAMLEMSNTDDGKTLLETIHFQGIEAAQNTDWDDVRELNIHLLDDLNNGQ